MKESRSGKHATSAGRAGQWREGVFSVVCGSLKLAKCQGMPMSIDSVWRVNIIREGYSNNVMYYFDESHKTRICPS